MRELLDVISDDVNYHDAYFDNFFTSLPLLEDFQTQGIRATGTVRLTDCLEHLFLLQRKYKRKKDEPLKSAVHQVYVLFNGWITRR